MQERGIYQIASRNLRVGVWDGTNGFIGIREKFDSRFLFTEYHWDLSQHHGTVRPIRLIGTLPGRIEIRCYNDRCCSDHERPIAYVDREIGWKHADDDSVLTGDDGPIATIYRPLFDYLEQIESTL